MIVNKNNYGIDCFTQAALIQGEFKSSGIERKRHLQQVMPLARLAGHVMEFGVYRGKTIKHIAAHWPNQTVWGFDSFQGLPEAWTTSSVHSVPSHPRGHFDLRGEPTLPEYPENVQLVPGWFSDSIPKWIGQHAGPIAFLHIDCDLYSSTNTVLDLLNHYIVPGTVIVFDEMYPWNSYDTYDLWAQGEYKAVGEWLQKHDRSFEPLLRNRHQQCSIRVVL